MGWVEGTPHPHSELFASVYLPRRVGERGRHYRAGGSHFGTAGRIYILFHDDKYLINEE